MKIGIIVAMEEEYNPLLDRLMCETKHSNSTNLIPEPGHYIKHSDVFYTFNVFGHEILLVLAGIGMNNSQLATSFLVMTNKVDVVINYGLAGATSNFNIGDIISVLGVANMDFDLTSMGRKPFEVPGVGNCLSCKVSNPEKVAYCYSSNQFVSKKYARSKDINQGIFDMELYGIVFACSAYKIPVISLKIISDNMDSKEFNMSVEELSDKISEYVFDLLKDDNNILHD